ncbi:MAG: GspE/PulE family protein [Patescibacteria group bacterium]|nr:GspE/PulE family protein [Patescibacteria group bacterium]
MNFQDSQKPKIAPEEVQEKLSEKLEELKIKELENETQKKAFSLGLPYLNLKGFPIAPEALRLIPEEEAKQLQVICFYRDEKKACLATLNPERTDFFSLSEKIKEETGLKIEVYLISPISFDYAIKLYRTLPKMKKRVKAVEITEEDLQRYQKEIKTFRDLNEKIQNIPLTDLVAMVIAAALQSRASDIHIEAEEEKIKLRFRIDGILVEAASLPKRLWPLIISRLKILAGLKINITTQPQDGRFSILLTHDKIDVRVSTLPSSFGESVVMRILMASSAKITLEELGFRGRVFEIFKREIERPNGLILTSGPTGSGKSTTLYAILMKLASPEIKIITLEEPIEYELKGVIQTQVDYSKGQTFAKNLRSVMRQDPDVIMVGEIRDQETAEIAVQAALTGHLVFSTIHANDAAGIIPRFLTLGVKPYLLAPALNLAMAQRLVRRICQNCREEIKLDQEKLERVKKILNDLPKEEKEKIDLQKLKFFHGRGCESCQNLGYYGRVGIFEVFTVIPEIEKLILRGDVSEYEMREVLKKQGMVTLVQDGLLKALDGITSVEEVFRVAE